MPSAVHFNRVVRRAGHRGGGLSGIMTARGWAICTTRAPAIVVCHGDTPPHRAPPREDIVRR